VRKNRLFMLGVLSVGVVVGLGVMSNSSALAFHRADLIESLQETVVQPDSMRVKGLMRVDVIEHIGSEGPVQSYTPPMSH
jgi:hypothetical protein